MVRISAAMLPESALAYAAYGWPVLPLHFPCKTIHGYECPCKAGVKCKSPGKHPTTPNGLKDASTDPHIIKSWFGLVPRNLAIRTGACSGIVLDIDPRHGGDESLSKLEKEYGPLPHTVRFLTGSGGQHIMLRHPGVHIPNSASEIAAGIDVRGDDGYIVAPPSLHVLGRLYAVSVDHHPEDVSLADMPGWLLERILAQPASTTTKERIRNPNEAHRKRKTVDEWRQTISKKYLEGNRNTTVTSISGQLLRRGIDPHVAVELMLAWNQTHCEPPLDDEEVVHCIRSVAKMEIKRRGGIA